MSAPVDPDATALGRALWLMAPATTVVVAAEFIVVGLLPLIAQDLRIPLAQAGALAGWYAFSAAVAGPFVTLVTSRLSPRLILTVTLSLYAVGNFVVAVAPDLNLMLAARIIQGALLPGFISVGASVVTRLAPSHRHGKGLARANVGFVLGVLLALPAGVAIAQGGNWRLPFLVLATAPLLFAPLVAHFFPRLPAAEPASLGGQLGMLRRPQFLAHLGLSALIFASMFSAYTYLGAWVEKALDLPPLGVALVLFLFGVAGLLGNGIAGRFADVGLMKATVGAILILVVAVNLVALAGSSIPLATVPLVLWSVSHTAGVTLGQVRVTLAGREAPPFAMTMNISFANLGIAAGTLGGGWVVDAEGVGGIGLAPVGFAALALLMVIPIGRSVTRPALAAGLAT